MGFKGTILSEFCIESFWHYTGFTFDCFRINLVTFEKNVIVDLFVALD